MRIAVIGGSGRIGARLVQIARAAGHDATAVSRRTGVDIVTGAGVDSALAGADAVVDVSRSPSMVPADALAFFTAGTRTLLAVGAAAGVAHHVTLSVVAARRMPGAGFLQAKVAQEELVRASGRPFTIVAATQFYEFAPGIAASATRGDEVRLPDVPDQPIAADDVAAELLRALEAGPLDGTIEVGGPEVLRLPDFVGRALEVAGDSRRIVVDPGARYFGALLTGNELLPGPAARHGAIRFAEWLAAH
ncbi:SDR family oxidoreductase [Agromyces protaetiae]|uniref:SDR family oxidoreductase n=1 Tax=Agromyces protaetiae TaxID=2509455 RepID=A0A4P6FAA4_9MICO|nr:SDR family oxidoreductase [Agromyces protaetiae]QAY72565.1 SDR family oxidoreductase [Agromyces protaetiae]